MSVTVVPNRGILLDDHLDGLRVEAMTALFKLSLAVPQALVDYIQALEREYLNRNLADRVAWLEEVGWPIQPESKP